MSGGRNPSVGSDIGRAVRIGLNRCFVSTVRRAACKGRGRERGRSPSAQRELRPDQVRGARHRRTPPRLTPLPPQWTEIRRPARPAGDDPWAAPVTGAASRGRRTQAIPVRNDR
ncbi:hypothetical protein GCM10020366_23680 [Saccharopolyspora gregorii]|uniref:Uncharacterized protein n=1 Tax=Saccharopolyspora gregorii TaxID=33914 RepID=A0ABP6RN39_9PSEU